MMVERLFFSFTIHIIIVFCLTIIVFSLFITKLALINNISGYK